MKARCGGPAICEKCAAEYFEVHGLSFGEHRISPDAVALIEEKRLHNLTKEELRKAQQKINIHKRVVAWLQHWHNIGKITDGNYFSSVWRDVMAGQESHDVKYNIDRILEAQR